jgi:xylitol oxidase
LAALAEVSIAGATQTGTHGSGLAHQCLASQLRSMQLVLANGTAVTYQQGDPEWNALAISLGAFGVITQMELTLVPSYKVTPYVFLK